ncbi:hypothetical protein MUK42_03438 [Musa troglodytarum]|uniref:Uncharacterized protein n=1 Tax=Musa troglodytarum TaxID=320322 RepID=A0A9E7H570_9LILI|nr:hypothetical protein MUK42_03438 [Musa troglodytarum]
MQELGSDFFPLSRRSQKLNQLSGRLSFSQHGFSKVEARRVRRERGTRAIVYYFLTDSLHPNSKAVSVISCDTPLITSASTPLSSSPGEEAFLQSDMDRDAHLIPSSPSNSSLSSSDLDTEVRISGGDLTCRSTGSFFPDRSTTLGTLMGVTFAEAAASPARLPSRRDHGLGGGGAAAGDAGRRTKPRAAERRRRHRGRSGWWRLCRDDMVGPTSLGEFLQVERRMAGGDVADGHYVFGGAAHGGGPPEHVAVGGGPLFADGRVLPPAPPAERRRPQQQQQQQRAESVGRLPVLLLTGICSGGDG